MVPNVRIHTVRPTGRKQLLKRGMERPTVVCATTCVARSIRLLLDSISILMAELSDASSIKTIPIVSTNIKVLMTSKLL